MLLVASPPRRVRMPVSPEASRERSSSGTLVVSSVPRMVRSSCSSGGSSCSPTYFPSSCLAMKAFRKSIGTGKIMVEFFSAAISVSVCR